MPLTEERCHTANLSVKAFRVWKFFSKALSRNEPLSHCFAMPAPPKSAITQRTSQSKPFGFASSPDRGATGVPVLAVLDEQSFLEPKNGVLRCLGQRHLSYALTKGACFDVVCLDSGALLFTQNKTSIVQQGLPDLPMAPLFRGAVTEGD